VSPQRYWTLDEARAALPRVKALLLVVRHVSDLASTVRSNGHANVGSSALPAPFDGSDEDQGQDEEQVPKDLQSVLDELEELGIILRDPSRGLIDFPALHQGRTVHLCWQLGEDGIDWWHLPDAGFAGRRPLPLPEEW
jgi:Uncharacterized conserved protein (DUF2203)